VKEYTQKVRPWGTGSYDEQIATLYRYHYDEFKALGQELSNRGYVASCTPGGVKIYKSTVTTKEI